MAKPIWILLLFFSINSYSARNFKAIEIPNTTCADGSPYKVFYDKGRDSSRLAVKLKGGNACWSYFTCFQLNITPKKAPESVSDGIGFGSDSSSQSPVASSDFLYFPYCTGDVFLGDHRASYRGKFYSHGGRQVVEKSMKYLAAQGYFSKRQEVVLYGDSAGAMGALYHLKTLDQHLHNVKRKTLIADSPGLHFGDTFWSLFTDNLFSDYSDALAEINYPISKNKGLIAGVVPQLCQDYPDWEIGIMQTSRDRTMSLIFGQITESWHERKVFSSEGIYQLTKDASDNCSAFVPKSNLHVILNKRKGMALRAGGISALKYVFDLVENGAGETF
ncbi:MAG: pectin acetylesterase-family hydrolase [Bdellovibrionales bacterium]